MKACSGDWGTGGPSEGSFVDRGTEKEVEDDLLDVEHMEDEHVEDEHEEDETVEDEKWRKKTLRTNT
jgi:hypothetical protein